MMGLIKKLRRNDDGTAGAEAIMVAPLIIVLAAASMELGNFFLIQHAVTKQVRDGARYASRLSLASAYACPGNVFDDANATTKIINVTENGAVTGTGSPRFTSSFWAACQGNANPVSVSIRCIPQGTYEGIYSSLDGDIPVVTVSADVRYPSLFGSLGFPTASLCIHADSDGAVAGL